MRVIGYVGILLCLALTAWPAERLGTPIKGAHAHNDYEHPHPLWDALAEGFCSVEADIYLVDGVLLVGHNRPDLKPDRTLQKLYLDPLRDLVAKNGGRVYPKGPGIILLIDIKTEAEPTYAVLQTVLQGYSSMLTRFRKGQVETNAVTVILSGNRPRDVLLRQEDRLAAYDGRLADLGKGLPASFMPLVSDSFTAQFASAKEGSLSAADRETFLKAIEQAHREGRQIRFWAMKDSLESWKLQRESGVDLINTDRLAELAAFLRSR